MTGSKPEPYKTLPPGWTGLQAWPVPLLAPQQQPQGFVAAVAADSTLEGIRQLGDARAVGLDLLNSHGWTLSRSQSTPDVVWVGRQDFEDIEPFGPSRPDSALPVPTGQWLVRVGTGIALQLLGSNHGLWLGPIGDQLHAVVMQRQPVTARPLDSLPSPPVHALQIIDATRDPWLASELAKTLRDNDALAQWMALAKLWRWQDTNDGMDIGDPLAAAVRAWGQAASSSDRALVQEMTLQAVASWQTAVQAVLDDPDEESEPWHQGLRELLVERDVLLGAADICHHGACGRAPADLLAYVDEEVSLLLEHHLELSGELTEAERRVALAPEDNWWSRLLSDHLYALVRGEAM